MWKEMRKGKCKTKRRSGAFFLCTLHLRDGWGEKGGEGGRTRLKTSDEKENTKIWREKQGGQKREKGRKEAKLEREGEGVFGKRMHGYGRILTSVLGSWCV